MMAKSLAEELLDRYEESVSNYLRALDVQASAPTRAIDIPAEVSERYKRLRGQVLEHLTGTETRLKPVDTKYWGFVTELKKLLDQPLPGGRGFQRRRDKNIHRLTAEIAKYETPSR